MEKLNKQKLKCDGYQFHQYQESEQSPLTSTHRSQKHHVLQCWKKLVLMGFSRLIVSQQLYLDSWISNERHI